MVKKKISPKQQKPCKIYVVEGVNEAKLEKHVSFKYILNKKNLIDTIIECLENNDFEGVLEVVQIYIKTCKKAKNCKPKIGEQKEAKNTMREQRSDTQVLTPKFASGSKPNKSKKVL